jgi:RNA recognition motif-containing protein
VTRVPNQNGKLIKQTDIAAPPLSNGYGFVCFQTEADARKAVEMGKFGVI